jgi:hypothetical protein
VSIRRYHVDENSKDKRPGDRSTGSGRTRIMPRGMAVPLVDCGAFRPQRELCAGVTVTLSRTCEGHDCYYYVVKASKCPSMPHLSPSRA